MMNQNGKEENFVSAVFYVREGDQEMLVPFLEMVCGVLDSRFKKYEVICVNDGAGGWVERDVGHFLDTRGASVTVVSMGFEQGLEAGMCAGMDLAVGDFIFEFDSVVVDFAGQLVMDVYEKCLGGYDIVSARPLESGSRISSRMFYTVYNHFSKTEYRLATERFRIVSRRAVNRVSAFGKTVPYRKAVYAVSGLNIAYIEFSSDRGIRMAGYRGRKADRLGVAVDACILFTDLAYRVALFFSLVTAVAMFASGVYTVFAYFWTPDVVPGWAPLMGLVSLGFLSLFVLMAFMFKYMEVTIRLMFRKQKYTVRSIEKL